MIIIAGTIDFESQVARDAAVAKAVPYQESTRADEAGCLGYSFAPDSGCGMRMVEPLYWSTPIPLTTTSFSISRGVACPGRKNPETSAPADENTWMRP